MTFPQSLIRSMRKKARSEIAKGRNAALIKSKFLIRMINVVGIALNAETSNIKVVCLHFVPQISCLFTIFPIYVSVSEYECKECPLGHRSERNDTSYICVEIEAVSLFCAFIFFPGKSTK